MQAYTHNNTYKTQSSWQQEVVIAIQIVSCCPEGHPYALAEVMIVLS
jgi:hypothetical protein